jgi:hypothetical protein
MKSNIDIEKIKENLPHGALTEIATKSNVSLQTVCGVLRGKSQNRKVLIAIADYLSELKMDTDRLISLID